MVPYCITIRELIPECLSLLGRFAASKEASHQIGNMALLPYRLAVANTFAEVPEPVRGLEGLFPLVEQAILEDHRFQLFRRQLLEDERFNGVFPVPERDAIGANIFMPGSFLISVLWRYLVLKGGLAWEPDLLDEILERSREAWERQGFRLTLSFPLFGLSGAAKVPEIAFSGGWFLRPLTDSDRARLDRVRPYVSWPCTMVYSGEVPPVLGYTLVREDYFVSFNDFAAGWDMLRPEKLPVRELEHILDILQTATSVGTFGRWYSIYTPVAFFHTADWAANPFGNPFGPNYFWPLSHSMSTREWFAAPAGWEAWVERMYAFVESAPKETQQRYRAALRWFREAVDAHHVEDRLMKLFIALELLHVPPDKEKDRGGKGAFVAQQCAELINADVKERRRWRKFINKAYRQLRNNLFHGGFEEESLDQMLKDGTDLQSTAHCADMLELAFRVSWDALTTL